ncbi:hypothetical protein PG993_000245 [Apiospora rasikravindrae]|uniref:F-box domain-containing protein n=1 Tax=Apiospora rasikravindrae TaxID=990691 RepID=A0ABR1U7Y5_9PEZI
MSDESTSLGRFPLEIWSHICAQLANEISQDPSLHYGHWPGDPSPALKALCRVSKGVSQEAERALFRSYDSRWLYGDERGGALRRHLHFLRTVLDRPHLLSYVKEVSLSNGLVYGRTTSELVAETYRRLAARLGFDPANFPLEEKYIPLRDYDPITIIEIDISTAMDNYPMQPRPVRLDALLLLALPLFHNLQALTITASAKMFLQDWVAVFQPPQVAGTIKPFESIMDLTLDYGYYVEGNSLLDSFGPLLALTPRVERLRLRRCHHMNLDGAIRSSLIGQYFPRSVKSLEIDHGIYNHSGMIELLQCCSRLERFVYRSAGPDVMGYRCDPFSPFWSNPTEEVWKMGMVQALLSAKTTLKEVDLTFEEPRPDDEPDGQVTLADFAGFPALERLRVDGVTFLSKDGPR